MCRVLLQVLVLAEENRVRRNTGNLDLKRSELMPKKKERQKATESVVLDVYEKWLAKQPVRHVKGKPGFISEAEASS